jgi:hypothetical protein
VVTWPVCWIVVVGSLLDPSELLEIQIERVVYHIMCGYVNCVLDCRGREFLRSF